MQKIGLFASLLMMGAVACEQPPKDSYSIQGNLEGLNDPYIYMQSSQGDSMKLDSAAVTAGKFSFTGKMAEPSMAAIFLKDRRGGFQFFLENADIKVTGKADSLDDVSITGSRSQADLDSFDMAMKPLSDQAQALYERYMKAKSENDEATLAEIDSIQEEQSGQRATITKKFIQEHPASYVSLAEMRSLVYTSDYPELKSLYDGLDTSIQHSAAGKKFADKLAIIQKTSVGSEAPVFTQNDVTGKPVSLADFKGKYVLLDFWASWCGPCRAENPNVVKAYNKYKGKGFDILSVSLDDKEDRWKKAIEDDHLTWTHVSDLKGWKNEAAQSYAVNAIPANYLINPEGVIIAKNLRGDALEEKLAEALK